MNIGSFTFKIKAKDIYVDITKDVKTRFDNLNHELHNHCLNEKKR